jgi:hypothetical protein
VLVIVSARRRVAAVAAVDFIGRRTYYELGGAANLARR